MYGVTCRAKISCCVAMLVQICLEGGVLLSIQVVKQNELSP
jgi:hypothetical protein